MNFNYLYNPYPSRRSTAFAKRGMVATSQNLAAEAGLSILRSGGNAVDAAIATAACLTVVEPTSNGIGGDAFALIWMKDKLHGLNASGSSPRNLTYDTFLKKGYKSVPKDGWLPVTVPGVPSAWQSLSDRFGKLPLSQVLLPAIEYAENGYPMSPVISKLWQDSLARFTKCKGNEFLPWFETFAASGKAPLPGEMVKLPFHAKTLKSIAGSGAKAFYEGEIAEKIIAFAKQTGGYLSKEDLAEHQAEFVEPINVNYRGYDVWEIPPNGHGIVALMALKILNGLDFDAKESVDTYHKQMEAMKLAYVDGLKYIADTRDMKVSSKELLSDAYLKQRRELISNEASNPEHGCPYAGGTVYLATADEEGNMVSYIQSNYMGFGSGIVVPQTGIALQNRGANFSLDKESANCYAPLKKSYHTIIPGFLTKNNEAVGPFGVMGAFVQPQGHVQMVVNMIDFHLNPQAALDAPRWQWLKGKEIEVESMFPEYIAEALVRKGHDIKRCVGNTHMGRGQIIIKTKDGVFAGGTEPRTDGAVAVW